MPRACVRQSATSKELQAAAGYAGRTRSFELRLNGLLRDGLLEMTVPGKPRSPIQQYRLTDEGRAALGRACEGHEEPDARTPSSTDAPTESVAPGRVPAPKP